MIKLLVLDVDGCLTDGKIIYASDSLETKAFNVKDGLAIVSWIRLGHQTGRKSSIVKKRADELGIQHLYQGVKDKEKMLRELVGDLSLEMYEVAVIGDDLNDYKMLAIAGRSFTPNDGVSDVQELVETVLSKKGGDAAVREMIDIIIEENDQKEQFLSLWIEE
ncbi:3-deoxy-D-manno-octulosonate 8-phosphate phosphatase [hydrothermal vent metagenome]|uniref:3-deoxy-D-manno-octulosonate 8-phosphate phosphatase n=1 Tax=hydrothermal vent metagenome TaxID=652676 RepID=A0A1W1BZD9_9ZZZZ